MIGSPIATPIAALVPLVALVALASASACASATSQWDPNTAPPIAKVWRARCGACHTRVEPGTHTRTEIDRALARHEKRIELSRDEWRAMADWLAPTANAAPAPAAPSSFGAPSATPVTPSAPTEVMPPSAPPPQHAAEDAGNAQ